MATDPSDLYPVIAQIAATFAGFGSLASGIGQRSGGDDARIDAYRLRLMLFVSLSATLLALLPATLGGLSLDMRWALGASALAAVIALAVFVPLSLARVLRMRNVSGFNVGAGIANSACALLALFAFAFCLVGYPPDRIGNLYLLGLMGLLGSSVVMFSRVIASMLRPHTKG